MLLRRGLFFIVMAFIWQVCHSPYPDFDMHSYEARILAIYNDYVNHIASR